MDSNFLISGLSFSYQPLKDMKYGQTDQDKKPVFTLQINLIPQVTIPIRQSTGMASVSVSSKPIIPTSRLITGMNRCYLTLLPVIQMFRGQK